MGVGIFDVRGIVSVLMNVFLIGGGTAAVIAALAGAGLGNNAGLLVGVIALGASMAFLRNIEEAMESLGGFGFVATGIALAIYGLLSIPFVPSGLPFVNAGSVTLLSALGIVGVIGETAMKSLSRF